MTITRDELLNAVQNARGDLFSIVEIAGILGVPANTAKAHFSRSLFRPVKEVERGKKIFDAISLKTYGLWLYLGHRSDCPLTYSANERDTLLSTFDAHELWVALEDSQQAFVNFVLGGASKEKQL